MIEDRYLGIDIFLFKEKEEEEEEEEEDKEFWKDGITSQ